MIVTPELDPFNLKNTDLKCNTQVLKHDILRWCKRISYWYSEARFLLDLSNNVCECVHQQRWILTSPRITETVGTSGNPGPNDPPALKTGNDQSISTYRGFLIASVK